MVARVEILDNGGNSGHRFRSHSCDPDDGLIADLDEPAGHAGITGSAGTAEASAGSPGQVLLGTLTDAAALALTALILETSSLVGGYQMTIVLIFGSVRTSTPQAPVVQYAQGMALYLAPATVLAVAALLRVRPCCPPWVRAVTGAATLVGVLLLAIVGYALWHATQLDAPFGGLPGS